ncbi:MAG: hypothetical protein R6X34_01615 [Chloroflexota bacterium]
MSRSLWRNNCCWWGWLLGLGYGLLLWLLAMEWVVTAVGAPLAQISAWQFALAHLIYGLVLGFWLGRNSYEQGEKR